VSYLSCLQASLGTAQLLVQALQQQGLSAAAAKSRIWMVDSKGLILNTRQMLSPEKAEFAQSPRNLPGSTAAAAAVVNFVQSSSSSSSSRSNSSQDTMQRLAAIVAAVQPTALIGAAAVQGAFDQQVIAAVTQVRPTVTAARFSQKSAGAAAPLHATCWLAMALLLYFCLPVAGCCRALLKRLPSVTQSLCNSDVNCTLFIAC
jgi:hypothetical protein